MNGFCGLSLRSWGIIKKCTPFEPLHERSVGCAFRIRIGHYFQCKGHSIFECPLFLYLGKSANYYHQKQSRWNRTKSLISW
uniref:Uncharacterized protein n=1 Tax=Siphoviridae sp. ctneY2 TaxID=2825664 RepID=A0A8S5V731_9CAUD|nr:MAG TPA: hypothetical protein [Siphoviridae sp. ctneY2]